MIEELKDLFSPSSPLLGIWVRMISLWDRKHLYFFIRESPLVLGQKRDHLDHADAMESSFERQDCIINLPFAVLEENQEVKTGRKSPLSLAGGASREGGGWADITLISKLQL